MLKPSSTDPYLFRIPVRPGTNLACAAEMTRILARGQASKTSEFPLFCVDVWGIMANPRDPNYVYVEAGTQD